MTGKMPVLLSVADTVRSRTPVVYSGDPAKMCHRI